MTDDEVRWNIDQRQMKWKLPPPAPRFYRLPVIRRIRAIYLGIQIEKHYGFWSAMGSVRSGYDGWVLYAIQRGWC